MKEQIDDRLWEMMELLLPKMKKRIGASGRPPREWRGVTEVLFWVLKTGEQWSELPKSTVYDRFQFLMREDCFRKLGDELLERGKRKIQECFIEGMFVSAKKRTPLLARSNAGKAAE